MHVSEPGTPVNAKTAHDADYEAPVLNVLGEFHVLTQRVPSGKQGGSPDGFGTQPITRMSA
jgi:hypothetical protein